MKTAIDKYNSIGEVVTQQVVLNKGKDFTLESGDTLGPVVLAYETYGVLNEDKSNAILILHALS